MFPNDTITFSGEFCGNYSNFNIFEGEQSTILGVGMQQANNSSDTTLKCGADNVARNYATNFSHVPLNRQCEDDIHLDKTGQDCAFVIVNYVPYLTSDYSTTTQYGYNPATSISSSSDIQVYGAFSAGEVMIAFILLLTLFWLMLTSLVKSFGAIKTKKRYIEYSNGDVPIREEL